MVPIIHVSRFFDKLMTGTDTRPSAGIRQFLLATGLTVSGGIWILLMAPFSGRFAEFASETTLWGGECEANSSVLQRRVRI